MEDRDRKGGEEEEEGNSRPEFSGLDFELS